MNNFDNKPIIAIATAAGRGGIGVVRISGSDLSQYTELLLQRTLTPRYAHFLPFKDAQGDLIDEGIAIFFKGPHSYTGEDVIELQCHGGTAVLQRLLQNCLALGKDINLRLAEPGEFTQRAFLNGRMDLVQAEAVADLIDASSETAARGAMSSLSGEFSKLVNALDERIIHLRMLVEATLDFPEEEIEFLEKYQAAPTLEKICNDLDHILKTSEQGLILREGLHVVLAGQPNVGKSSLLNALAGDDIAIVTPIAGTTRDRVIQQIHIQGVPLHIVDTAGLRDTDDEVESIGIKRTWEEIQKADMILHLRDVTKRNDPANQDILDRLPKKTPLLNVFNKIDLIQDADKLVNNSTYNANTADNEAIFISVKNQIGLDHLRAKILAIAGWQFQQETPWLARSRHISALRDTAEHLSLASAHAAQDDRVLDLFAEELRLAHDALSSITGQFTSDDLLGEIFSSFCIGK